MIKTNQLSFGMNVEQAHIVRNPSFDPRYVSNGHAWEIEFFGLCSAQFTRQAYVDWPQAMKDAVASQSELQWDPSAPPTDSAFVLYEMVKRWIKPQYTEKLKLYCFIGTAMDFWHGADGAFVIDNYVVAVDLTCASTKGGGRTIRIHPKHYKKVAAVRGLARHIAYTFNTVLAHGIAHR